MSLPSSQRLLSDASSLGSEPSINEVLPVELLTHSFSFLPTPFSSKSASVFPNDGVQPCNQRWLIQRVPLSEIPLVSSIPLTCRYWLEIAHQPCFYDTLNLRTLHHTLRPSSSCSLETWNRSITFNEVV